MDWPHDVRVATKSAGKTSASSSSLSPSSDVKFTNLDRIVFPASGYTKGDVLEFYSAVAAKLLPHLRDRPVTLERLPEGVTDKGPRFWQKNTPSYYPSFIPRVNFPTEDGKPVHYALVNDLRSLLWLANQNVLTFHTWLSRAKSPDKPDFVLFDIDPHQSSFANAVTVAKRLHAILDEEGLDNFIKTSGKSGLHVLVPWPASRQLKGGYDQSRGWAIKIADRVAAALPKIATTERSIAKRGSRVYVDAMQNGRGKHAVPPYVLRPTAEGTVSMPLAWKELTAKLSPQQFDLKTAMKRIAKMKADPLIALTGKK
ncbi:MAG: bifunctional non-ous end joining protein LigD [Phycisphaerales bacterium]|nr:bifunctional non-ous end joining protein LigD [Phycisphaerales bacterium]